MDTVVGKKKTIMISHGLVIFTKVKIIQFRVTV